MAYTGRTKITTAVSEITEDNLLEVLSEAVATHNKNVSEMDYLYNYYTGQTPIQQRTKEVRPEICAKKNINTAYSIVNFKTGYIVGDPIQYVSLDEAGAEVVSVLNSCMRQECKPSKDKELFDFMHIFGTAYRAVFPKAAVPDDDVPYDIYTIDPRQAFVIYSSRIDGSPMAGVYYVVNTKKERIYSIYTQNAYYEVCNNKIVQSASVYINMIPIIEYPANTARLGAFEPVLDLLDAKEELLCDQLDSVSQFVQSLMVITNAELPEGVDSNYLRDRGLVQITSTEGQPAKVELLSQELNQTQTQELVSYVDEKILEIVGMPGRNGTSSGDNGIAVIYRDGFTDAETRAKASEMLFKQSEFQMLRLIAKYFPSLGLSVKNIDCSFTRKLYDNLLTKAQVLTMMLSNDKIAPQLAFQMCSMFPDAEAAWKVSKEYYEKQQEVLTERLSIDDLTDTESAGEEPQTDDEL